LLQTIPQIGQIRAAMLLGIVGTPARFRARRKFWAYGGLGVVQRVSSEHRVENGQVVRESRTRGVRLSKSGQPLLKKVLSDIALHASIGRGELRTLFDRHVARGKRPAIARLTLARKIASVIIAVWRTGKPYDALIIKRRKKVSGRASIPQLSRRRAHAPKATALSICRPESRRQRGTG
jgi:transposase